MINIRHSILVLFILLTTVVFGQTEAEMKVQADKLFDSEQYLEATPLYLRLLSLQPRDVNYNYRYGTCLLYNSNNKSDAIKYLGYAVNDPAVVPEAYYFLGKAFHLNYQFNEAIKHYTSYNEKKAAATKKFDADREIQMCMNGKRLMTTISDLIVIDKKEITSDKFFRIYELSDIGGSMLVTTDFQTKIDKRNNHVPLIHFPQTPTVIYYSSYGENEANGKDIYVRRRLPDGSWGMAQPLPGNVNTKFDEDFPYMHPDGNYLYFSSKGHNSMGGFDVFRSKYDPESNAFGPPENMDFAISSPDDDLFYIVDSLNKNAYFASARQSQVGKLFVYKVKVDRVPLQLAVIKGNFVSEIDATNKRIDFEIKDYSNGENIGKFNSNEKAVYLITFPKGGKYEFIMRVEGSPQEFRSIVSIPFMKEFKPLKQKIIHTMEEGKEVVKIINLFNEEVEDPQAVIAEVIKMRSNLNVNVQDFDMDKLEEERKSQEFLSELGFGALLMTEVSSSLADEVDRARTNKQEIEQINNNINNLVVQNGQDFTRLEEQIKNKVADANKTENQENKYILLREAEQLIKKQNELKESSKRLLQLQDSVNLVAKASPTAGKIDQLDQVAKQFDKLYREGKEDEALAYLKENKDLIRNALNDNSTELKQNLVDRVVKLEDELSGLSKRIDAYNREIKELELEIQALENSRYSVKKKELEALEAKIVSKKEEIEMIRAERIKLEGKSDVISTEKYFLNKQIEVLETALTNPTLAKVSREEANRSLLETSKTNTNTLTNYVQQQIAELEKNDPTLRERITVTSGMKGDNIMAEHRTLKQRVDDTPGLSKQERLNRLLNTTTSTKKALEQRLKDVETQLEKNKFDEKLIKEKQQIIRDLEQLEREIEMYQQELGSSQPSDVASIDTEKIQEDIDPDYTTNYEEIESDVSLSEEERLSKQQVLDQDLVQEIEKKIDANNKRIQADPGNQELKKNQQALNLLKEQKQKAIVEREKVINASSTQTQVAFTRDEVIKNADPAYVERFNAINNDRTKPEVQRFNELQKIDKQLVTRMNERIAQLEKQVKNNPQDKNAIAELDALRTAVLETEKDIDERSALIDSIESGNVQLTAQEILSQLDPAYETKINEIKNNRSISEKERLELLNTEDEDLISKIDRQIADKQALLKTNPQDTKVQQELKTLLELRSDKSKDVEQRKTQIDQLNAGGKEVASIEALDPEYNDRIKEIESASTLTQKEKLEKIQQEDKQLVNRINEEVEKIEESATSNDPETEQQLEQLRTLKSTTEQAIEIRDEQIEKAGTQTLSTEQVIAQLDPDYAEDLKDIQLNTKLSDSEKLGKTQLRDKELLSLIEKELVQVDQKLKADPSNPELINRKEQLTDVKMSVESRIEERNQLIESQATSELTAEQLEAEKRTVLKEIDASYDKKKATLLAVTDNISYSDLITLEEKLLAKLEAEKKNVQKLLAKDPSNKEAIKKLMAIDSLIDQTKAEKERWENLQKGEQPIVVTENEKAELIAEIDPRYTDQRKEFESTSSRNEEILKDQLAVENSLLDDVEAKIEANQKVLSEDPGNTELIDELKVLESIKVDLEEKIKVINAELESVSTTDRTYSSSEIQEKISEIDAEYSVNRREIENNPSLSQKERLEELNALDRTLQNQILEKIGEVEERLENDPGNQSLKDEKRLLEQIAEQLEESILDREKAIVNISSSEPLTKGLTEEWIDQLDENYRKDVAFIEKNNAFDQLKKLELIQQKDLSLLNKVDARLESISKMPEPKLAEVKNEEKALSELKDKLLERTQERATEIDNQRSNALSTLPNKSELVEEIMPGFESNRAAIETDSGLDESFKKDMIVQLEEALQQKAEQRLEEVEDALGSNSTDVSLNKEKQLLAEIIAESKNRVKENQLENLISSKEREMLIGELFPDYESRKEQLAISKMEESKKIDVQLKLENELLTKLQAEVKLVQKQLDKNPSDETLIKRLNALNLLIDEQQTRISELNQRKIGFASAEIAENAIRSADKTYAEDVKKIEAQIDGPVKQEALANREALLQKNLNEQIEANTKQLDKKSDPELETANQALKQELINSEERESNYKEVTLDPIAENKKEEAYIENLREDLLSGNATELSAQRNELSELKKQDEILAQYELDLKTEIKAVENELSEKSGDTQLKEELQWLKQELTTVQAKRREVNITIGELETELISANSTEKKITSPELEKLEQEERTLEQQLKNQDLTATERKNVEKELAVNRSEQVETENKVLEAFVEEKKNALTNELKQLNQSSKGAEDPEVRLVEKQVAAELNEVAELVNAAEKTKNETEKNYLLNEAVEKQETAEAIVENAIYEQELKRIEEEYGLTSLDSKEELEKKKRRYTIEVGELTTELELLNNEIATADKKEVAALTKEKSDKTTERILVQEQLSEVEKALAALPKENSTLSEESKDVVLSFNEERDLASTKEYANYVEKVNEALRVEQQIINLEKQLNEAKAQTKALAADNLEQQTTESKAALEVSANKVKQIEEELATAKSELAQKQQLANEELPQNTDEAMKMQNLVRRGVAPINKLLIAAALVPMPANGLDINADGPGTYSEANRIPVNVTSPQGLVYRVQIGAFAKPIEQNRFKEFTPVSGETLNNGITRYMAGYFNNSNKVLQAMNQIRALGYADAFPVAYCDGKRISLAEARRLEATGECVPKGTNELMMEIAANTAVTMGLEDTTKLRKVPEFTYNQAPGAAKAEPIEMRKGLFFTVQIGVYNKPVPSATLFNLEPYMTIRLPNGQIRYSTGIYHSIDEARPRKQEAINRGVKDAFITAYFNGERIPINDALKMLEERGTSILEPKEKPNEADTTTNNIAVNNPVIYEKTESPVELPKKPKVFMQIVTKKQFETFPVEVLNRYNSHGSFYYDENDKRVKSSITNSDDNLPQVYYFREDIDTVRYLSSSEFMQGTILSLTFAEGKLPGDVVDWLLRQNYRKEYLQSEEGVTMLIHGVPEEKFSQMEAELTVFGMSFTKVAPKEEEVEKNK